MAGFGEASTARTPGLEPWQFYGPTTRAGERVFLAPALRPTNTVTVRGWPLDQVRAVPPPGHREGAGLDRPGTRQTLMAGSAVARS